MIWTLIILYSFVRGPELYPGRYDEPRYRSYADCMKAMPKVSEAFYRQAGEGVFPRAAICVNDTLKSIDF